MIEKLRFIMEIESDLTELVSLAIWRGYRREEPRKRWTKAEQFKAVKWLITILVLEAHEKRGSEL